MTVLGRERSDEKWTVFRIQIDKRYKHDRKGGAGPRKMRRGQETKLWVRTRYTEKTSWEKLLL